MRKTSRGLMALLLIAAMGAQTGCGSSKATTDIGTQENTDTQGNTDTKEETGQTAAASVESMDGEVEKPEKITVLYDMGTLTQTAGLNEWIARWE